MITTPPKNIAPAGAYHRRRGAAIDTPLLMSIAPRCNKPVAPAALYLAKGRRAQLEAITLEPGNSDDNREAAQHDLDLEFPSPEERRS